MKALFIGLGGIGQRHLRNLKNMLADQVEVIAYRSRKLSAVLTDKLELAPGEDLETKYQVQAFDDLDAALAQKLEIAFICNPTAMHIPVALKVAQAGCHLFIEKPLSHSVVGVDKLINLVQEKKLAGYVGYQLRFHPCLVRGRALLDQKAIGQVLAVEVEVGEYLPGWHTYEDYRQMYAARKDLGGGVVLSQIHELDYLYWFFGMPKRVFTLGGHLSSLEIDVEDVASSLLEYELEGKHVPVHIHQDYVQRPPSRSCKIIGDSGKILLDLNALTVSVYDSQGRQVENTHFELISTQPAVCR